jgi:spore germination cell wall hydrolase CwlJ-like protein
MLSKRLILPVLLCLIASLYADDTQASSIEAEHQCLALALYWEARGETRPGIVAVGWTILNRANSPKFPATLCGVVHQGGEKKGCQFSWWCDGKSDRPRDRDSWTRVRVIASELLTNPPPDPTGGALFFHSTKIGVPWTRKRKRTARIGNHVFYR